MKNFVKLLSFLFAIMLIFGITSISYAASTDDEIFVTQDMVHRTRAEVNRMLALAELKHSSGVSTYATNKRLSVPHLYQDDSRWQTHYSHVAIEHMHKRDVL